MMIHDPTLIRYLRSVARFFGGRMPTREALAAMENRAMWDITGRANNWDTFARVQSKTIARPRPVCNKAPIPPTDVRCIRILNESL